MTVLILGAPEDPHAALIYEKIRKRERQAVYLDTRRFPAALKLNLTTGPGWPDLGSLSDETGRFISLEEITAVYWRAHMGILLPEELEDSYLREMAQREIDATLGSLFQMLPCRWVNSPAAIAMHGLKAYQLSLLHRAGIRVPQTLISNDPDAVHEFYNALHGQIIYKPVRGGAYTQKLTKADLSSARLDDLAKAPVQFQEFIEGVDIRAYLMKDEIFAAEIHSRTLDFRDDPDARIVPVTLPEAVQRDCRNLGKLLELVYSGIDLRRTPQGEYVFLEGNPSPMFLAFESQTGCPISDRLVDLLLSN